MRKDNYVGVVQFRYKLMMIHETTGGLPKHLCLIGSYTVWIHTSHNYICSYRMNGVSEPTKIHLFSVGIAVAGYSRLPACHEKRHGRLVMKFDLTI